MLKKNKSFGIFAALFLLLFGVIARFLPHPANFAPIAAIALFGAVYLPKRMALILPLAAMFVSDLFIGFYGASVMIAVYASFLLTGIFGLWLRRHKKWYTIGGGTILSAILFFIVTNFAVWAFTPWYAKTLSGLLQCFSMALPFFRNTLFGNMFYATSLFGAYELASLYVAKMLKSRLQVEKAL